MGQVHVLRLTPFFTIAIILGTIIIGYTISEIVEAIQSGKIGRNISDIAIPLVICVVMFVICIVVANVKNPHREYVEEKKKVDEYNAQEKNRVEVIDVPYVKKKEVALQQINLDYRKQRNIIDTDYNTCSELLAEAYSLNIIPSQYRDLKHIYFLYQFMSTSNLSFEQAILQGMLDDRFDRIEAKLDRMIEQNEELIFHTRCIEATTREMLETQTKILETNQRMLDSQERTEQNTREATQNARIAANYAEINAFFATANYLDRQR